MPRTSLIVVVLCLAALASATAATANTSHANWPEITGALIMNESGGRLVDMRVGKDPFGGKDPLYRCNGEAPYQGCFKSGHPRCVATAAPPSDPKRRLRRGTPCTRYTFTNPRDHRHNELLGEDGSDTIYAGANGDVLWGDMEPDGQPTDQHDVLVGGAGKDIIFASHGTNTIRAGAGDDWIKAHYGRGTIDCGPGHDVLYISHKAQPRYHVHGCEVISHKTLGH